jgi:hypothetical protein
LGWHRITQNKTASGELLTYIVYFSNTTRAEADDKLFSLSMRSTFHFDPVSALETYRQVSHWAGNWGVWCCGRLAGLVVGFREWHLDGLEGDHAIRGDINDAPQLPDLTIAVYNNHAIQKIQHLQNTQNVMVKEMHGDVALDVLLRKSLYSIEVLATSSHTLRANLPDGQNVA